jgi:hypothetical protein
MRELMSAAESAVESYAVAGRHSVNGDCDRADDNRSCTALHVNVSSNSYIDSSVGNSDNQRGALMSSPQLARDEEIRCVSPQRVVASSSSRMLPFPTSPAARRATKLAALELHDPVAASMLEAIMDDLLSDAG